MGELDTAIFIIFWKSSIILEETCISHLKREPQWAAKKICDNRHPRLRLSLALPPGLQSCQLCRKTRVASYLLRKNDKRSPPGGWFDGPLRRDDGHNSWSNWMKRHVHFSRIKSLGGVTGASQVWEKSVTNGQIDREHTFRWFDDYAILYHRHFCWHHHHLHTHNNQTDLGGFWRCVGA